MNTNAQNYYLLGQAVGQFHGRDKLTPACVDNLLSIPNRASIVLRHVWTDLLGQIKCQQALEKIDWESFRASIPDSGSFWLGYYQKRGANENN